jgi:DNA polymerase-1
MKMNGSKRLFILDISGYIFRSYYALPPMQTNSGEPIQAIYGLVRSLLKILEDFKPDYMLAVFDGIKGSSTRRQIYSDYKANRIKAPSELISQIPYAYDACKALGIPYVSMDRHEADDLIGVAVLQAKKNGWHSYICSSDKDMLQLVSEEVWALHTHKDNRLIDPLTVKEILGVNPSQVVDWLALCGDSSDNIPGVAGIGPKTAAQLLERFGTLENIIENLDQLSVKQKEKFDQQSALISKQLATLRLDLDFEIDINQPIFLLPDSMQWMPFFEKMGFKSLLKPIQRLHQFYHPESKVELNKKAKSLEEPKLLVQKQKLGSTEVLSTLTSEMDLFSDHSSITKLLPEASLNNWIKITSSWKDLNEALEKLEPQEKIIVLPYSWLLTSFDTVKEKKGSQLSQEISWVVAWKDQIHLVPLPVKEVGEDVTRCLNYKGYWIAYDAKTLQKTFLNIGIRGLKWHEDLRLAAYLVFADSRDLAPISLFNYFEIVGFGQWQLKDEDQDNSSKDFLLIKKIESFFKLQQKLEEKLIADDLNVLYQTIELPLSNVLAHMECVGCYVDLDQLAIQSSQVKIELEDLEKKIKEVTKDLSVNLNSPKQVSQFLFETLELPVIKKNKTGASTDAYSLEQLKSHHPIIEKIIRYRELEKLRSTYLEALPQSVNPITGRIHPHFEQAVTSTGRLSCRDPNLQNIPVKTSEGLRIRKAFTAKNSQTFLLSADYSQIELRVMAHLSEDEVLQQAFRCDEDIHRYTASIVFNVEKDSVSHEQRDLAKAVNFGIIYGQQAFGLSKQLNIPHGQASRFIEVYFERYRGVRNYIENCKRQAKEVGYVSTLLGRRRYIPEICSPKGTIRQLGERLAVNTPVQGSAADLIKLAMIEIEKEIRDSSSQLILQIHDELIFEVHADKIDELSALVKDKMENVFKLNVPLKVNIGIGKNWMEC